MHDSLQVLPLYQPVNLTAINPVTNNRFVHKLFSFCQFHMIKEVCFIHVSILGLEQELLRPKKIFNEFPIARGINSRVNFGLDAQYTPK